MGEDIYTYMSSHEIDFSRSSHEIETPRSGGFTLLDKEPFLNGSFFSMTSVSLRGAVAMARGEVQQGTGKIPRRHAEMMKFLHKLPRTGTSIGLLPIKAVKPVVT